MPFTPVAQPESTVTSTLSTDPSPAASDADTPVMVSVGDVPATAPELPDAAKGDPKAEPSCPFDHHIHALEDGLTVAGQVLYRGQEFDVEPDTPEWGLVHPNGKCLLNKDAKEQRAKFGHQMWGFGAWPYEPYDLDEEGLTDQDKEKLARENASRNLI